MAAAGLGEPGHQRVVRGLEEHDAVGDLQLLEVGQALGKFGEEDAAPNVRHQRHAGRTSGRRGELRHLADERRGEVVHDEIPDVLEALRRLRPPRAGQPGDDGEVDRPGRVRPEAFDLLRTLGGGCHRQPALRSAVS